MFRQTQLKQRIVVIRLAVNLGCRCTWRFLKNCVNILIGREPFFDEDSLFFRQLVLHVTGIRPIREITCPGLRAEGAGSQALMIMSAINFARSAGLGYLHTPFSFIAHAERPMEEWVAAWESFFNLGAGELVCDLAKHSAIDYCRHFNDLYLCFGWFGREDKLFGRFGTLLPEFRRKHYLNKSPRKSAGVTVAVHVRRGDAHPDNPWYYTSNEAIHRTITAVKTVLDARRFKYSIRVYSQGHTDDFAELCLPGVEFFLDTDPIWTMGELIEADILVMAKGCFSHYAALISDGIKIGGPEVEWGWYLSPPDNWIPCQSDGSFECAEFENKVSVMMASKEKSVAEA